jgi:hypothetical protein
MSMRRKLGARVEGRKERFIVGRMGREKEMEKGKGAVWLVHEEEQKKKKKHKTRTHQHIFALALALVLFDSKTCSFLLLLVAWLAHAPSRLPLKLSSRSLSYHFLSPFFKKCIPPC